MLLPKVVVLCYLGGLLTAFDLVDTGLSQSDPVSDALQLAAVLLYTVRHPGSNTNTHTHTIQYSWVHHLRFYCSLFFDTCTLQQGAESREGKKQTIELLTHHLSKDVAYKWHKMWPENMNSSCIRLRNP